jgi:cell division protein FtsW
MNGSAAAERPREMTIPETQGRVRKKFRVFSVRGGMDLPFFFLVLVLVVIGLIMMFSASYANASYYMDDSYYYIKKQVVFAALGIAAMIGLSYFDYHHFHKLALPVLIVSAALLGLVLVTPEINGVHRWLRLGPLGQLQPSEVAKFAVILLFAHLISLNFSRMGTFRYGVLPYVLILAPVCGLLVKEPHISATVIILILAAVMLFIGGVKLRWFGIGFGIAAAALVYLVKFSGKVEYAGSRISGWLDPMSTYQTKQSLYAIGSGGLLGLGLGQSRQKYLFLPEPQNDFIFAIVCEELGFVGALIIIILFAMLVWRGVSIALRAQDKFGMLLGTGLVVQVGLQVVLNIAVVTNTIPNTGISLPFFSYGGTSLVILLAEMGIVLSISRTSSVEKT